MQLQQKEQGKRAIDSLNGYPGNVILTETFGGSGVSTDIWTSYAARIMVISVIPFLIVQIPQVLKSTSGRHLAVLVALIVSLLLLGSYCFYQVFQPWIQRRRLAYVKHKHVILGVLKHLRQQALGRLLKEDGEPDREIIKKLFSKIDENGDGQLSHGELRALVVGIEFDEIDLDHDDAVTKIIEDFDTSRNSLIDEDEFFNGINRWLSKAKRCGRPDAGPHTMKFLSDFHQVSNFTVINSNKEGTRSIGCWGFD